MSEQHPPILIFAQSGRFLAQEAIQAGYNTVWVADCFADLDLQTVASRWSKLPPFSQLDPLNLLNYLTKLAQDEPCQLICGSGIEQFYPVLSQLPENILLIGNTAATINIIKTPSLFFPLLSQLNLPYPETQFERPKIKDNWLVKSMVGMGGEHIQPLGQAELPENIYFQHYINGTSASALFLADGQKALLLTINTQWLAPCENSPYRLGGIETPFELSATNQQLLESAINCISNSTGLLGLNSIDFIITAEDELLFLEVNPRLSASCELIADRVPILQYHINACNGQLPDIKIYSSEKKHVLQYVYAASTLTIPETIIWPEQCHDLPETGTLIEVGQPVCTIRVMGDNSADCQHRLEQIYNKVNVLLSCHYSSSKL